MTPRIESFKSDLAAVLQVAFRRHRGGESAFRIVEGFSDSMDGILRPLFLEMMNADVSQVALIAVGGTDAGSSVPIPMLTSCSSGIRRRAAMRSRAW